MAHTKTTKGSASPAALKPTAPRSASQGSAVTVALARDRKRFLRFLSAKLDDAELAEEILQVAYLKRLQKAGAVRDGESPVTWFFRVLRNAIVDHHRQGIRQRRLGNRYAGEQQTSVAPDELRSLACRCVGALVPRLRPDYAASIRRIDLEEASVPQLAAELGITSNNARVRVHRARQALCKQVQTVCGSCATHGCRDCSCSDTKT